MTNPPSNDTSPSFASNVDPFKSPAGPSTSRHSVSLNSHPSPKSMHSTLSDKFTPTRGEPLSHPTSLPRPPLRTALSGGNGSFNNGLQRSGSDGGFDDDKDELTTKGRKRKRLAKACSACHKNKRRCDGFAPCSNCEFSSRPCLYLNAQGEPIPPPRTRDSSIAGLPQRDSRDDSRASQTPKEHRSPWSRRGSGAEDATRAVDRPARIDLVGTVERDLALSSELIQIFFRRVPPFGTMFHLPTFYHRLYLGQASPLLLDVMYAFACRLCDNPVLLAQVPPHTPAHARGEPFAERAHHAAERVLKMRRAWSDEEARHNRGTWEETEFAQAMSLLSIYFAMLRQPSLALFYLDIAIYVLRPGPSGTLPPPSNTLGLSNPEWMTLMETRHRTFWLIVLHDLCAAANGRPRRLQDHEVSNIPLPGDEIHWSRMGGTNSSGRDVGRRDGMLPGTGSWAGEEGQVGELGHVLRILSIFSDIMTVANKGGAGSSEARHATPQQHEHALKSWALNLPRHLRFDEANLSIAITKLNSPVPEVSITGWLYTYMHAVAECGMFYLQATLAQQPGPNVTAQRQNQAVDNIGVILDALTDKGREGPLLSNWQDHLRSSSAPPTASQLLLDERLNVWWSEIHREWGQDRFQVAQHGHYPSMSSSSSSSHSPTASTGIFHPPPHSHQQHRHSVATTSPSISTSIRARHMMEGRSSSGLGLYQPSPPFEPDSALSNGTTASSFTLPTPSGSMRHTLPPLRPRAASVATPHFSSLGNSPSPPFGHRKDQPGGGLSLPPIGDFRKTTRESEGEAPSSPRGTRYQPYPRPSPRSPLAHDGDTSARVSPLSGGYSDERVPRKGLWKEPLGIAALVSAAEAEARKESAELALAAKEEEVAKIVGEEAVEA